MDKKGIDLEAYKDFIDHFIDKYNPNINYIKVSTEDLLIEIEMSGTKIEISQSQPTGYYYED